MNGKQLRNSILQWAISGRLVPQDSTDEPASALLKRINPKAKPLSPDNAPFPLPDSWVWTTLGEISDYGSCGSVDVNSINPNDWVLELEDIEKDSAKIIKTITKSKRDIKGVRHKFHKGQILYSKLRTYLNKVLVTDSEGFCTTEIIPFDVKDSISLYYICHVLRSQYFLDYANMCGYGVKMPRLSTKDAQNGLIPLPPLAEQERIVRKLEELLPLVERYGKAQTELDRLNASLKGKLRASVLQEAISGRLVPQDPDDEPASALLKRINPKATPLSPEDAPFPIPDSWCWVTGKQIFTPMESTKPQGDFVYVDIEAVNNKTNRIDKPKLLTQANAPSRATRKLHNNDVLFSMVRPYLKNIALVTEEYKDAIASTGFYVITPTKALFPMYLFYMLISDHVVDGLNAFMKGDNSPSINNKHIEEFPFPIPPLAEQERIVRKLEELLTTLDSLPS